MKFTKLFVLSVISISMLLPIQPIKSFNHESHKTLVLDNKNINEFSHKISYFNK